MELTQTACVNNSGLNWCKLLMPENRATNMQMQQQPQQQWKKQLQQLHLYPSNSSSKPKQQYTSNSMRSTRIQVPGKQQCMQLPHNLMRLQQAMQRMVKAPMRQMTAKKTMGKTDQIRTER